MKIPLITLWKEKKDLNLTRELYLSKKAIVDLFKISPIEFVIADVGKDLNWITVENCFTFWKSEVVIHLADDLNEIFLDEFPENYAYVASLWKGGAQESIVLLEKFH